MLAPLATMPASTGKARGCLVVVFGRPPPEHLTADLLRRMIDYRGSVERISASARAAIIAGPQQPAADYRGSVERISASARAAIIEGPQRAPPRCGPVTSCQ